MFFKKFEFINFTQFKNTLWDITNTQKYSIIAHFIIIIIWFNLLLISGVLIRSILFSLSFFFISYWFISIFIYLFKKSKYGTFTRIIQRFWKRALYLFWLIEVGLFCIYLFLTLISPQEVSFMLDNQQLFFFYNGTLLNFFKNLLNPILIILLTNIYLLAHKYNTNKNLIIFTLTLLLINALYEDLIQFYSINQHYLNLTWNHIPLEITSDNTINFTNLGIWEQELAELKLRPYIHYLYLLVFLKLWHTMFIVYMFLMLENARLYLNYTSFNIISANLQNFYFLLFFNFILKISLLKTYFNYLGTFIYYWFYINYNLYDIGYLYHIFNINYIIYMYFDVLNLF